MASAKHIPTIVVDSSAFIAVLMREPGSDFVARVLADHILVAPQSIDYEIGNALIVAHRRGRISDQGVQDGITAFQTFKIERTNVDLTEAARIAVKYRIFAYDAYMIQCAASQAIPLLTLDQGLDRIARAYGVAIVEVFK